MKIVVSGASGFLGGRLLKYLSYKGYEVLGLSRNPKRNHEFQSLGIAIETDHPYEEDKLVKLLEGSTCLVHCAALSSPWASYEAFYEANVSLSKKLLSACIANQVRRFVNVSTPSIYFDYRDRLDITEQAPLPRRFVNGYAKTKYLAEQYILEKNGQGIETISLRPRAIIGAEDAVLFPRLMRAYESGRLRIIGSGKNLADFTSVQNLVEVIEQCIHVSEEALGLSYNISNGNAENLWEVVNSLIVQLDKAPITKHVPYRLARFVAFLAEKNSDWFSKKEPTLTQYGVGVLAKSFSLDIQRATKKLGYQPSMTTTQAIDEFISWYKRYEPNRS